MTEDAVRVSRSLAAVQRALAISQLPEPQRQWLAVFNQKLTRMRDNGTALKPENRARLERMAVMVDELLERHRQALN